MHKDDVSHSHFQIIYFLLKICILHNYRPIHDSYILTRNHENLKVVCQNLQKSIGTFYIKACMNPNADF